MFRFLTVTALCLCVVGDAAGASRYPARRHSSRRSYSSYRRTPYRGYRRPSSSASRQPSALLRKDPRRLPDQRLAQAGEAAFETFRKINAEMKRRDQPEKPLSPEALYEKCASAVVSVAAIGKKSTSGTGFLNGAGTVVTNFHVVAEATEITVTLADGRVVPVASVIWGDRERDLAVLSLTGFEGKFRPHPIASPELFNNVRVGSTAYVIGDPQGLRRTLAHGLISAIRDTERFGKLYQISVPVSAGSSGSPVFNQYGRVIAVVTSSMKDAQNLNFCVPIDNLMVPAVSAPMSLAKWAEYSRPVARPELPGADRRLLERLLKAEGGLEAWPLRSIPRLYVTVDDVEQELSDRVTRDALWRLAMEEIRKLAPGIELSETFRPGEKLDLEAAQSLPRAYVHIAATVIRRSDLCAVSFRLSLKRSCLFERDGSAREPSVLDDGSQPAVVWERSGFLTGTEAEVEGKLLAALRERLGDLARALDLANPQAGP